MARRRANLASDQACSNPNLSLPKAPASYSVSVRVSVRVWDHACTALDQGEEAGEWVSEAIGQRISGRMAVFERELEPLLDLLGRPRGGGTL